MDADGSHSPQDLPRLLTALLKADVVLGSRYIPGGATPAWPLPRKLLSQILNQIIRSVLHLPYRDCTTGFRALNLQALEILLNHHPFLAQGFAIQFETLYLLHCFGPRITEVPITFLPRKSGHSKLRPSMAIDTLRVLSHLKFPQRTFRT